MTEAPQNEAAQLVIGMVIVGLIVFGIVGSFILKWIEDRAVDDLSTIPPSRAPEITSSSAPVTSFEASPPRTDAGTDGRALVQAPELKPATLDTVRELRAHGFTRDAARALLRREGRSLGNNTWADAAPADSDELVTPYAGRRTRASYYPDRPDLEYVEP